MIESKQFSPFVYLVEDEPAMRASVAKWLKISGIEVQEFDGSDGVLDQLAPDFRGTVLSDVKMPRMDGMGLLRNINSIDPDLPVVLFTGHGDIAMAVEAMRIGAYDFIEKPFEPERLLDVVKRALEKRRLVLENRRLTRELESASGLDARLIGSDPAIREIKREILNIAPTDANVLIHGETGTGKEIVARSLHEFSLRRKLPFVAVNCAALPTQIVESELFGHERGSFTGADQRRIGKLEAAHGGTLFLDELTGMSMEIQAKLLRALEDRKVTRLGSNTPVECDFRLIAAMNEPVNESVKNGKLRKDLLYRLGTVEFDMPPLRLRKRDVVDLFGLFCERAAEVYERDMPPLTAQGAAALIAHSWPGNVRELRNVAERYVLSSHQPEERLSRILEGSAQSELDCSSLPDQLAQFERHLLKDALKRHHGKLQHVMAELGLPRRTLSDKMTKYGLAREHFAKARKSAKQS